MIKPTYSKVILRDGRLVVVPDDYTERHELVRVTHPLLAQPLLMAAYMTATAYPWKLAIGGAAQLKIYERPIRAPEVEEAFLSCDRSVYPSLPVLFFPDAAEYWGTWTSTPDAENPAGYAWSVSLDYGHAYRDLQSGHGLVRGVVAGQYSDLGVLES